MNGWSEGSGATDYAIPAAIAIAWAITLNLLRPGAAEPALLQLDVERSACGLNGKSSGHPMLDRMAAVSLVQFLCSGTAFSKAMLNTSGRFRLRQQDEPSAEKRRTILLLLMIPNQFLQSDAERGSDSFQNVQRGIGVAGFNGAEVPRADKALCGKVVL